MPGALQPHEFGDLLEILPEHELIAFRDDRNVAHPERERLRAPGRIIQHIDRDVVDLLLRRKRFRSKAARSPRLREEYELVGGGEHVCLRENDCGRTQTTTRCVDASSACNRGLCGNKELVDLRGLRRHACVLPSGSHRKSGLRRIPAIDHSCVGV